MLSGLLVGSRISWRAQIDPVLLSHGIDVCWWWPSISHMKDIPRNCDVVIVMTDCCSHKLSKPAMAMARKASVPLICGNHRKAKMVPLLESRGFLCLTTHAETVAPGALDLTQLAIGTMCASILSDLPELSPEEEIPMPAATVSATDLPVAYLNHAPGVSELKGAGLVHYRTVLRDIAESPWLVNATIADRLKLEPGSVGVQCSLARETLGLLGRRGRLPARVLDRARYEAACLALGVTPVAEDAAPALAPPASYSSANGDRAQLESFSTLEKLTKAVIESKSEPPPEPATPVATTGLLPGEPTKDTLEVLKLLLEAMRVEGVEFVSIDERGKVSIRRRVTISSNLSL